MLNQSSYILRHEYNFPVEEDSDDESSDSDSDDDDDDSSGSILWEIDEVSSPAKGLMS